MNNPTFQKQIIREGPGRKVLAHSFKAPCTRLLEGAGLATQEVPTAVTQLHAAQGRAWALCPSRIPQHHANHCSVHLTASVITAIPLGIANKHQIRGTPQPEPSGAPYSTNHMPPGCTQCELISSAHRK